jgi:hypothetical protein
VILREAAVEHGIEQASLARREDFRHAAKRGRERAVLGDETHASKPLGDQHATVGQERQRPGVIQSSRHGLHREVAGGRMENLRAGGRAAAGDQRTGAHDH